MRKILSALLFSVGVIAAPLVAQAAPCSPSLTFTTGQTLTAPVLNSNPTTFSGCFNNIDYTNIGSAGIFASQMMPTNSSQSTFGGGQNYTFPNNLTVGGTLTAAIVGGLYPSSMVPTTGAQATFGGSQLYTFPNGVAAGGPVSGTAGSFSVSASAPTITSTTDNTTTVNATNVNSTGPHRQTVSGTTYTLPYDAMSTAGSTNTHIEHGSLTTGGFGGGASCATSQNFVKPFTAAPDLFYTFNTSPSGTSGMFTQSKSASAFTACAQSSGAGSFPFSWLAIGE